MVKGIIGNPYKFSIIVGDVKEWNIENAPFFNGIMLFLINGELFPPKNILNVTLPCQINWLKKKLKNIPINKKVYNMEKEKAFIEIYDIRFPENIDIDEKYEYDISPTEFSDRNYYVFAVRNSNKIRILASKLKNIKKYSRHDLNKIDIIETFITNDELNEIIIKLEELDIAMLTKNSENNK
jgi:hypothetical protein